MTQRADVAVGHDIVARWCTLAEQRLEYLSNMFETGRWRRYYSELAFLENIKEARAAVETWRRLATGEPSPGLAIEDGSNGEGLKLSPPYEVREPEQGIEPQQIPIVVGPPREIPSDVLAALESHLVSDAAVVSEIHEDMALPPLALDVMQERYPLLRNAL
jgi:uncharacterized repeat protein (TIGR03809 family)